MHCCRSTLDYVFSQSIRALLNFDALFAELEVTEQAASEEWVKQAQDMLAGGEPRAQVDKDLLAKLRKDAE